MIVPAVRVAAQAVVSAVSVSAPVDSNAVAATVGCFDLVAVVDVGGAAASEGDAGK